MACSTAASRPAAAQSEKPAAPRPATPPSGRPGASAPAPAQSDQPALGQSFVLKAGESATLSDAKVTVRFESVLEDSRCPTGEQCVWAGNARVLLQVAADGGQDAAVELNTNRGDKAATVGRFRVTLEKVEPQRISTHSIAPRDYRATISLSRV